jgi:hypothetical protein
MIATVEAEAVSSSESKEGKSGEGGDSDGNGYLVKGGGGDEIDGSQTEAHRRNERASY